MLVTVTWTEVHHFMETMEVADDMDLSDIKSIEDVIVNEVDSGERDSYDPESITIIVHPAVRNG